MSQLLLTLLGDFRVTLDGVPLSAFQTDKMRALLTYLTVERRVHARNDLAQLLWPGYREESARNSLRQSLHQLRHLLLDDSASPPWLLITRHTVQINPVAAVSVDVNAFSDLIAQCGGHVHTEIATCADCLARLRQAVELYQDDFLAGFTIADSDPFEEWRRITQEQLHLQALNALTQLANAAESAGQDEQALQDARHQLALEPWLEVAHRLVMRVLAKRGQRTAAMAQYNACRQVLTKELGDTPDAETTALYEQIRRNIVPSSSQLAIDPSPALQAAPLPRHNLPEPLTPFVGREDEMADIAVRLCARDMRLLTLVGPGGMGKTRLALETARAQLDDFADGAFFVSLAPLASADAIMPAIYAALSIPTHGEDAKQSLLNHLATKRMLLILDNFEHVLAGANIVADILQAAPDVRVIATSREPLNMRGEYVIVVRGMVFAPDDAESPAIRLFEQTARRVKADFALDPSNVSDVLRICELVQGMPLGLELAAAWCETMSVADIVTEINASADFLATDWRDAPERQRSLRAVFDWSWHLLSEAEQQALSRLSIFRGGFTRQAAQAVTDASLRVLAGLVRKSLLRWSDVSAATTRYEMHELIRQFADEKLQAAPIGDGPSFAERHSDYFLNFVAEQEVALYGRHVKDALSAIQFELDNVRQAWSWAIAKDDFDKLNLSVYSLGAFYAQTNITEGRHVFSQVVDQLRLQPGSANRQRVLAKVLAMLPAFQFAQADFQSATATAGQGAALARACGDQLAEALALVHWADALNRMMDCEAAEQRAEEALSLVTQLEAVTTHTNRAEQLLTLMIHASSLLRLSRAHELQWHFDQAIDYAERALVACRRLDAPRYESAALDRLGEIHRRRGNYEHALQYRLQALTVIRESGDLDTEIFMLGNLGLVYLCLGAYDHAINTLEQGLHQSRVIGSRWLEANVQETLAHAYMHVGQPEMALRCAEGAEHAIRGYYLNTLGLAYERLSRFDDASRAYHEGIAWWRKQPPNAAVAEAHAGLARLALAQGDDAEATAWVQQALLLLNIRLVADGVEPLLVYESCYLVLKANGDVRTEQVLQTAHQLVTDLASRIADPALRRSFLNIRTHREIEQAFDSQR